MKKIFLFFVCTLLSISPVFSYKQQYDAKYIAEKIREYITENIPLTQQFPVFDAVREKIKDMIISLDNSQTQKRQLFKDIAFYHNDHILQLVAYITSRQGSTQRFLEWKNQGIQDILSQEQKIRNQYNSSDEFLYLNILNETVKENDIYRVTYTLGGDTKIFKQGTGFLGVSDISYERKIPFYEIIQEGGKKFLLYNDSFFREDGYFQTYKYSQYYFVDTTYGVYASDFNKEGFDYDDAVFLRLQDAKNNVTLKPEKVLLFPESYLSSLDTHYQDFVNTSIIDVLRKDKNYEKTYKDIIQTSQNITQGIVDEQEKIQAIYDWMIQNVIYPQQYDLEDYRIFSGLEAFENGYAVCEGQALLMYYLLKLAGIEEVEYIDGYVVNASDFPSTRHAWIKIGDYFYDPAFEKTYQEDSQNYLYYKIPYDIIYTNRYNTRDIPEQLFTASKENIKREIERRRYALTEKYNLSDGYTLLEKSFFRKRYDISPDTSIILKDIIPYLEVYEYFLENGVPLKTLEGFGKKIEYYPLDDIGQNIEAILQENHYDISSYVLLRIYENQDLVGYGLAKK